jgi:NADPH-dependent F420 reductase
MKVGIIGAGNMGSAFARRLSAAGHEVFIASRDIEDAQAVAASVGASVRAVPQPQLADRVDLLIAATPFPQQSDALRASGRLEGKTVVEISNPLKSYMSWLAVGLTTSAAEEVAKAVPRASVVKAFNTVFASHQADPVVDGVPLDGYVAGDDERAKKTVLELVKSIGLRPIDAGPLTMARALEGLGWLNISLNMNNKWPWQTGWKLVGRTQ